MRKFILIILLVFLSTMVYADNVDFTKEYTGKGVVTFNHTTHSKLTDCEVCHNPMKKNGVDKKFSHKVCRGCHKIDTTKKAPTKCNGCHKK